MAVYELSLEPRTAEIARLIDWVKAHCGADGIAEELTFKVALAVEEAVINVIGNAFLDSPPPHRIGVRLDIRDDAVAAEVIDNGRPFDPTAAPEPDLSLPIEQRYPGGLGIHLMRKMMDCLQYRRSDGQNHLLLQKSRS